MSPRRSCFFLFLGLEARWRGRGGAAAAAGALRGLQECGSAGRVPAPLRLRLGRARRRGEFGTPAPSGKMDDEGSWEDAAPAGAALAAARRSLASASARQLGARLWEIHNIAREGRRHKPRRRRASPPFGSTTAVGNSTR